MKTIIWAKRYLTNFNSVFACITLSFWLSVCAFAKVETGHLFVQLSDAMAMVKQGESEKAQPYLQAIKTDFYALENHTSVAGKSVDLALKSAMETPNLAEFEALSKALYAFEKEQNPVDYTQKRQQFAKRVLPIYQQLNKAIEEQSLEAMQSAYSRFNATWSANEKVVRETSLGHYGQIETAMTFLRIAMLAEPINQPEMRHQAQVLGDALTDFIAGNVLQVQKSVSNNAPETLIAGVAFLEKSYQQLQQGEMAEAQSNIRLFIQQWAIFEGEVRTRDATLYHRVESELPVILAKGNESKNLQNFDRLITDLKALDASGQYSALDAMLILLREGVEALLIIMALLTTLKVAQQPRAQYWVYGGAIVGGVASFAGAFALHQFFPLVSAGTNREILEGGVGIVAVVMMLFVGAWLHSKSSVQGWKRFMDKQVSKSLATGSLISMFSLSFLSVFREGAETILFYAGMLPLIDMADFLLGIGLALGLLSLIALLLRRFAHRLPIHLLFRVMTGLIYLLGFKILGVSVNALQLTQVLPRHYIEEVSNIPMIGFYASWEGIGLQAVYLFAIFVLVKGFRR
ncbi:iron permease [Pasteurellaceae bacterium Macca]|nr:iron permease [Pasteurellaceae bacterium Macca]